MTDHADATHRALVDVAKERGRQEGLKMAGRFPHTCADAGMDDAKRLAVLMEEVGEVARALQKTHDSGNLREELVQVAAIACAWVEFLDGTGQHVKEVEP